MKKVYELIIKGVLVAGLLVQCLPVSIIAYADSENKMESSRLVPYVLQINNGNQQNAKTTGFIQDGLLMIPAADLFNHTGFRITHTRKWMNEYKVERNEFLSSTVFNTLEFSDHTSDIHVKLKEGFNQDETDELLYMPTYATFKKGRLYVPLNFIASILNYDVRHDELTHLITLDYWGDQNLDETNQVKDFVNHYMKDSVDGYNPDHSLYTTDYLDYEADWLDSTFSDGEWPEPNLVLKDWNIRYLFFMSKNEAIVKVPYWAEGKASRKAGGIWLSILKVDGKWKVDSSRAWSQLLYLKNVNQIVEKMKLDSPEMVKSVTQAVYHSFATANAKKQKIDGTKVKYKTFPKNMEVLYGDDHIAYVYAEYNWSFKPTNKNFEKYKVNTYEDFIVMEKNKNGQWIFKDHYNSNLSNSRPWTSLRGNYEGGRYIAFMAFDDYYLNDPSVRPYISFF
ncbi:hypothetical protein QCD85_01260 [Paenibacillus sp. PsM32]|uniref:stalk domain-containing protein n=1 Tax=Paenibacillus sp. PsM32 TaxID=3030536 RepID=UPI00263BBC2C|nr:hypothetical protein [Paenibacillus sp. PsM32]MDN4616706.1 hypothetical protein [Paenibacillus sp. PsM32]